MWLSLLCCHCLCFITARWEAASSRACFLAAETRVGLGATYAAFPECTSRVQSQPGTEMSEVEQVTAGTTVKAGGEGSLQGQLDSMCPGEGGWTGYECRGRDLT